MILIKNGHVKTMAGPDLIGGDVLIEDGKIKAVGMNLEAPADAQVIDAEGKLVVPGFVDAHCHIGLDNEGMGWEGMDYNEIVEPCTPHLRGIDSINPIDEAFMNAVKGGVTTAVTGPGSANVIGGTGFAFKCIDGETVLDMLIPGTEMMKMAFGENPKNVYGSKNILPNTRMGVASVLREALFNAKAYSDAKLKAEQEGKEPPKPDFRLESLVPVVRGEMKVRMHAHRNDDIVTAVRIAKEFNLDFAIEHCTEGYMIKDFLAKEGVTAVVGPLDMQPAKMEIWNTTFANPGILEKAGVNFCLTQDTSSFTKMLPINVGIAIREGLSWDYALKAVTLNPAKLLGLEDRMGSLEVGKDADIAIFNGDPFCNYTHCKATFIDGKFYAPVEE